MDTIVFAQKSQEDKNDIQLYFAKHIIAKHTNKQKSFFFYNMSFGGSTPLLKLGLNITDLGLKSIGLDML